MARLDALAFALALGVGASSASPPVVVARVPTGAAPCGIDAGFGVVWVANYGGTIVRIDPRSNRVTYTVHVGRSVCSLTVGAGAIWAVRDQTSELVRLDPRTMRARRLRVGSEPFDLLVAAGSVWVTGHGDGSLTRIDPRTMRVVDRISLPNEPAGLAFAAASICVGSAGDGVDVFRIDPATLAVTRVPVGSRAPAWFVRQSDEVWVTTADESVDRIDPATNRVTATLPVLGIPAKGSAAPDGTLWIASKLASTVTRIDGSKPHMVDVTGAGRGAFAARWAFGSAWVPSFAGRDVWRLSAG